MQKNIRITESQIMFLSSKAKTEPTISGYLHKKSADSGKWQHRWFSLYQNLLFYYDNELSTRPSGVILLEGCYCEKVVTCPPAKVKDTEKQNSFSISYRKDGPRQYELKAETESEIAMWIGAVQKASFSKVQEQKEQLEQKHLHLLQILESERQAKWHYVQQTEELSSEVKKLKSEIRERKTEQRSSDELELEESEKIRKIKKVQSFFRGWLCRRRWKQVVELYINSEHADSMRQRNGVVFGLVECEEEYVKRLTTLVSVFLRPFRMAASSKNPPITHEDVNSIFLNSETLLFLHQIFLKGLVARMENWPTLVLDLFDMLLPMLGIYQEYVRNHHYSLQVLAEYKQKSDFNQLLKRSEEKPQCEGHSLATYLTYPMHQVPRYIVTIHELLARTPHDHVERRSLEFALSKLEEISQVMQDEVSETENIRKNLAIERMIIEGCDILLDVNQTFVRQGVLIQVSTDKGRSALGRLGSFSSSFKESRKETVRQVFLFTYHMLLTSRTSNGRLHLAKQHGKIPLVDCTLLEDSNYDVINLEDDGTASSDSTTSLASQNSGAGLLPVAPAASTGSNVNNNTTNTNTNNNTQPHNENYNGLDFRILMETKTGSPVTVTLVASSLHEKAAWCSDIAQCIENLHYSEMMNSTTESSSVVISQSVRSDPKLYRDDVDIKFSRSLNSCKVPQIRHATVNRLLDRLTDLRFMSVDFLNTFLTTYRVFTTSAIVIEALRRILRNPEYGNLELSSTQSIAYTRPCKQRYSLDNHQHHNVKQNLGEEETPLQCDDKLNHHLQQQQSYQHRVQQTAQHFHSQHQSLNLSDLLKKPSGEKFRRVSTGCMGGDEPKPPLTTRLSEGGEPDGGRVVGGRGDGGRLSLEEKERGSSRKTSLKIQTFTTTTSTTSSITDKHQTFPLITQSSTIITTISVDFITHISTTTAVSIPQTITSKTSCLLGLPRPKKLAPIASCETLSGSLDLCFPPGEQSPKSSRESLLSLDSQFSPDVQDVDIQDEEDEDENCDEVYYFTSSTSQPVEVAVAASSTDDSAFSSETSPMRASADDDHHPHCHHHHKSVTQSQRTPVSIAVSMPQKLHQHAQSQDRPVFNIQSDSNDQSINTFGISTPSIVALNLPIIATELENSGDGSSPSQQPRLRHRSSLTVPVSPHCLTVSPTPSFSSSSETLTGSHQLLTTVESTDHPISTTVESAPPSSPVTSQRRSLVSSLFGGLKGKINSGSSGSSVTTAPSSVDSTVGTTSSIVTSQQPAKSPPISPSGAKQRRSYIRHHHHHQNEPDTNTQQEDLPSDEDRHKKQLFQSPSSLSAFSSQRRRNRSSDENQIEALALSPATSPKFSRLMLAKAKLSSNKTASYAHLTTSNQGGKVKGGSPLPSPSTTSAVGFFQNFRRATSPNTFQFPDDSFNQQQKQQRRPPALYQLQQRHQLHIQPQQQLQRQLAVNQSLQSDFISPPLCSSCGGVARDTGDLSFMSPLLAKGSTLRKRSPSPINFSYSSPNIIINNTTGGGGGGGGGGKTGSAFVGSKHRLQRSGKHVTYDVDLTSLPTTTSLSSSTLSSSAPSSAYSSSSSSSTSAPSFPPPSSSSSSTLAKAKAGTVVTSSRASKRRSSSVAATAAFAAATAGSTRHHSTSESGECRRTKRTSAASSAALVRVLNILRHWVIKHSQDFEHDQELRSNVRDLLEEVMTSSNLLPAEHKLASSIMAAILKDEQRSPGSRASDDQLESLLRPPERPSKENFDTLGALDIAEQMTYLDHKIFVAIRSEELLGQAWMKVDKAIRSPHVLLVSKRFNEASKLVVCEIVSRQTVQERVSCIEKWAAIADMCRCFHNFNGVLQICAAFVNSSVYRLRKTWEKIPKQTRQVIERLQLLVSSDGRFKNMRDALHRCDPPCIPYLGMYLTDLSFIEEGTSNITEDGLINFSKMRMVAHVIREIQHFQQTSYRAEHKVKATNYLLDPSRLMEEEQAFRCSLEIEPRTTRSSVSSQAT